MLYCTRFSSVVIIYFICGSVDFCKFVDDLFICYFYIEVNFDYLASLVNTIGTLISYNCIQHNLFLFITGLRLKISCKNWDFLRCLLRLRTPCSFAVFSGKYKN